MIVCDWCGTTTSPVEQLDGSFTCGRCKRTIYESTDREKKMKATMQTPEYKEMMKNKIIYRTRGWPILEADARRDPEVAWKRLLNGNRYNQVYLHSRRVRPTENQ